ncbi:MAG: hypothetical protein BGP25_07655 [Lysobacterales bacterium 63-13]|nr:MAG: hypothetical protein BGP25_07655 [Xanthomonadales bacterium 63-13]
MPDAVALIRNDAARAQRIEPQRHGYFQEIRNMRKEARDTLATIKTLTRLEAWIRCAKAELASTPGDELLAEFIRVNERLVQIERNKLLAA